MPMPRICAKCCRALTSGQIVTALQKKWHPQCFVCHSCKVDFKDKQFYEKDETPYCSECWDTLFQPKCEKCRLVICKSHKYLEYAGKKYHEHCFQCAKCHKSMAGIEFTVENGGYICASHVL